MIEHKRYREPGEVGRPGGKACGHETLVAGRRLPPGGQPPRCRIRSCRGIRRPRLLARGFSLAAYLEKNADVADVVSSPGEGRGIISFEFGTWPRGAHGRPRALGCGFVRPLSRSRPARGAERPSTCRGKAGQGRRALNSAPGCTSRTCGLFRTRLHGPVLAQILSNTSFYAFAGRGRRPDLPRGDRFGAIAHFCGTRPARRHPPHPDHGLQTRRSTGRHALCRHRPFPRARTVPTTACALVPGRCRAGERNATPAHGSRMRNGWFPCRSQF